MVTTPFATEIPENRDSGVLVLGTFARGWYAAVHRAFPKALLGDEEQAEMLEDFRREYPGTTQYLEARFKTLRRALARLDAR